VAPMSLITEAMERLSQARSIRDMEGSDAATLQRFEAYMRHYGRMARAELDHRGLRPLSLVHQVEVVDCTPRS
jgi:hypothetical protein